DEMFRCRALRAAPLPTVLVSPNRFSAYCTRNPGVTAVNCVQPPRSRANCALLDPYHVASKAAWFSSVVATTQYFTPCCKTGAPVNVATAKSHVLAGTMAMPDTSESPGPKPQLSVYTLNVTRFSVQVGLYRMMDA